MILYLLWTQQLALTRYEISFFLHTSQTLLLKSTNKSLLTFKLHKHKHLALLYQLTKHNIQDSRTLACSFSNKKHNTSILTPDAAISVNLLWVFSYILCKHCNQSQYKNQCLQLPLPKQPFGFALSVNFIIKHLLLSQKPDSSASRVYTAITFWKSQLQYNFNIL